MSRLILRVMALAVLLGAAAGSQAQTNATQKKLLVVTVTKGRRHASIPAGLKAVTELAKQSGDFMLRILGARTRNWRRR